MVITALYVYLGAKMSKDNKPVKHIQPEIKYKRIDEKTPSAIQLLSVSQAKILLKIIKI